MDKRKYFREELPVRFLFFILIGVAAVAVMGFIVTFLWNYTLPVLFNVKQISFWQAIALLLLCRILFGSFGRGRFRGHRRRFGPPPELREKLMNMTEEERMAFREEMRRRCAK